MIVVELYGKYSMLPECKDLMLPNQMDTVTKNLISINYLKLKD